MKIILSPIQDAGLPEGMSHPKDSPCPFEGLGFPDGGTCCSLDATAAQEMGAKYGVLTLAPLLNTSLDAKAALDTGLLLRDGFVNALVFHAAYAAGNGSMDDPRRKEYAEARAKGEEYPDWPVDKFIDTFSPMGQLSDWLVHFGESGLGVRVSG